MPVAIVVGSEALMMIANTVEYRCVYWITCGC